MHSDRRVFLEQLAGGTAALAGLTLPPIPMPEPEAASSQEPAWDLSWFDQITGKHRAVFDCAEVEDGAGFFRAVIWKKQYVATLGALPNDLTAVVVIRHSAIPLAMRQEFWDKYGIGKAKKVKNPITEEPTTRNPILLSAERKELPPAFADANLDGFLAGKGIVLACNLAFGECVRTVAKHDKVDEVEARKRALVLLNPGVVLQPSGVFAAIRAQQAGCLYLRAS